MRATIPAGSLPPRRRGTRGGTVPGVSLDAILPTVTVPGLDVPAVRAWLEENIAGATGPFRFDLIAGGHSNLTYRVVGADGAAYVLRRPPLGHVLASAHDMGREHRIIHALRDSAV